MLDTLHGFSGLVQSMVKIFNAVLPMLVALALVLFMIGVIKYIRHEGEHEKRDMMIWSLVALFIMLSMWGIIRLMCASLTGSGSCQTQSRGVYENSGNPY